MSETVLVAVVGLVGTLIGGGFSYLATRNAVMAKTAQDLASAAGTLIQPLQERIETLEANAQKKIDEVNCLTEERDDLRVEVEALRKEVDELRKEVEALRRENKALKKALKGDAVSAPPYIEKGKA